MIRLIACAAILLSSTAAVAAPAVPAAPATNAEDAGCLLVAAELADDKDKEVEQAGTIMLMYFLGRLHGRYPGVDLDQLLLKAAGEMSPNAKEKLILSCSKELENSGGD